MIVVRLWFALSVLLGACSGGVLWIARATAQRRLGRNRFVGIRTHETLAADEAWFAAHVVAEPALVYAGLGGLAGSLVLLFLRTRDPVSIALITIPTVLALIGGVALAWTKGARAVRAEHPH